MNVSFTMKSLIHSIETIESRHIVPKLTSEIETFYHSCDHKLNCSERKDKSFGMKIFYLQIFFDISFIHYSQKHLSQFLAVLNF